MICIILACRITYVRVDLYIVLNYVASFPKGSPVGEVVYDSPRSGYTHSRFRAYSIAIVPTSCGLKRRKKKKRIMG